MVCTGPKFFIFKKILEENLYNFVILKSNLIQNLFVRTILIAMRKLHETNSETFEVQQITLRSTQDIHGDRGRSSAKIVDTVIVENCFAGVKFLLEVCDSFTFLDVLGFCSCRAGSCT